jgi:hypothetical protein
MTNAEGRMSNETPSMKFKLGVVTLVFALVGGFWLWIFWMGIHQAGESIRALPKEAAKAIEAAAVLQSGRKLPGEQILKNYASPSTRPEDDLQAMAHVFSNLRLLVKGDAPFRMGANEEFAAALMGKNATKEVFLEAPHACLNAKGQLVDRWGSPLFFHVRDRSRIDLRSAGPDGEMWTTDDLHRRHDGEFFRGEMLPSDNLREGK